MGRAALTSRSSQRPRTSAWVRGRVRVKVRVGVGLGLGLGVGLGLGLGLGLGVGHVRRLPLLAERALREGARRQRRLQGDGGGHLCQGV